MRGARRQGRKFESCHPDMKEKLEYVFILKPEIVLGLTPLKDKLNF
jgi:hypothetical protein